MHMGGGSSKIDERSTSDGRERHARHPHGRYRRPDYDHQQHRDWQRRPSFSYFSSSSYFPEEEEEEDYFEEEHMDSRNRRRASSSGASDDDRTARQPRGLRWKHVLWVLISCSSIIGKELAHFHRRDRSVCCSCRCRLSVLAEEEGSGLNQPKDRREGKMASMCSVW